MGREHQACPVQDLVQAGQAPLQASPEEKQPAAGTPKLTEDGPGRVPVVVSAGVTQFVWNRLSRPMERMLSSGSHFVRRVALHNMTHSFIELDKAVLHVIS